LTLPALRELVPILLAAAAGPAPGTDPPELGLDRRTTLAGPEQDVLARWRLAQAVGEAPLAFGTWRGHPDWRDTSGWNIGDSANPLVISPRGGLDCRSTSGDQAKSTEFGARAWGSHGNLAFAAEVRAFTEFHSDPQAASFDREFVDRSTQGDLSDQTFTSYSRYRATVEWQTQVGTFAFRREPLHWGPGSWENLALNRESIPFPSFQWSADFGNASIETVYGILSQGKNGQYADSGARKTLYAHRYEWRPVPWMCMGASEILVVVGREMPEAIIPVAPLFAQKGEGEESSNNGEIAFDLAVRRWGVLWYGEFLVDDMQEPTRLFDSYWGNRWGAMCGATTGGEFARGLSWDATAEWSHVEPWVYTHYRRNSAQISNLESPLGNPEGPNSRTLRVEAGLGSGSWRIGAGLKLAWKGTDSGSSILDTVEGKSLSQMETKSYLAGVRRPKVLPAFSLWKRWRHLALSGGVDCMHGPMLLRARLLTWL
jgi:hypothetical protein